VALRVAIGSIAKDKTGHGYKYTSNEATLNEIRPALDELNLVANEEFELIEVRDHQGKGWIAFVKGTLYVTDVETGQYIRSTAVGGGYDSTDKGPMKAMTAADKYNWWKLLQISTPDDPEVPNDVDKGEKASRTFVEPRSKSGSPGAPVSAPKPSEADQTQIQKAEQILSQKTYAPFDKVEVKVSQKGTHYARVVWRNAAATVFGPNVERVQGLFEAQKNVYLALEDSKGPGARPGDMIVKSLSVEGDA
jgi:hypothetical protein